MSWDDILRSAAIPWLLEPENPVIRYRTLRELLDRPDGDPEVLAAQAGISAYPPVVELLRAQKSDGYWVKRDYYLPKHYGTFWTLSVLADVGLTAEDERVERGCEYIFTHQRESGAFCRRRRVKGQGIVWDAEPEPCTHARIVRFLIQFGYGDDPRTRRAVDFLLTNHREDGMWDCHRTRRYGCLRATLDVLRAAALDPELATQAAITRAADIVCDLLMEPRMSRYHVDDLWTVLEYPHFDYGIISALDALAGLGRVPEEPKIAKAMEYLLSRQLSDGTWPLDQSPRRPPLDFGPPGEPSKWVTLDALRVIKLLRKQN
jgi:hypothetical protein